VSISSFYFELPLTTFTASIFNIISTQTLAISKTNFAPVNNSYTASIQRRVSLTANMVHPQLIPLDIISIPADQVLPATLDLEAAAVKVQLKISFLMRLVSQALQLPPMVPGITTVSRQDPTAHLFQITKVSLPRQIRIRRRRATQPISRRLGR